MRLRAKPNVTLRASTQNGLRVHRHATLSKTQIALWDVAAGNPTNIRAID